MNEVNISEVDERSSSLKGSLEKWNIRLLGGF